MTSILSCKSSQISSVEGKTDVTDSLLTSMLVAWYYQYIELCDLTTVTYLITVCEVFKKLAKNVILSKPTGRPCHAQWCEGVLLRSGLCSQ